MFSIVIAIETDMRKVIKADFEYSAACDALQIFFHETLHETTVLCTHDCTCLFFLSHSLLSRTAISLHLFMLQERFSVVPVQARSVVCICLAS